MATILSSLKGKMDQFIADPQLSRIELLRKQVAFSWTLGSAFSVTILTVLAYVLEADIIGHFGIVLMIFFTIEIPFFRKRNYDFYLAIFLAALIITAFIFVLIFGGITNSAGLIFVGLTCVISSILMKSVRTAFILFILYVFTILGLAVLNPFLTNHPDITPEINFIFFIINTIWMSAAMMFFIIEYLTERNKYQLAETSRLEEIDNVKSELFTSITHEFRTPITLISGMADQIPKGNTKAADAVKQIQKQSKKLLNLVNQILDLAKIDSKTVNMHFIRGNISEYLNYLFESFHSAADSKGILFHTEFAIGELEMDYDPEKLEAIVVNLVSNAIKFTQEEGSVEIKVQQVSGKSLQIAIEDTGLGIPVDEIENIFKRYFQVNRDKYQEGNGIGLTIVKEYLNLMNGQIEVISELGKGSMFKIYLPITKIAPKKTVEFESKKPSEEIMQHTEGANYSDELRLLLIIDDHQDIVDYVQKLLRNHYRLIKANNGNEGYKMALEHVPDIIISDVMMPEMDGFELLKKIKSEFRTSHIPVLMLTAKADRLSKLEGLKLGAEAYLVKPFDKEELFIRLRKLLDLRKILHKRYTTFDISTLVDDRSMDKEDKFMQRIHDVINVRMDDELFNINELCRELAMSHTQLYRKFSALTDVTVNKYIRQYRLHRAMNLLKTSELNVTQIAMEVGFSNSAYFSRIFTEEFGINPSKVKQATSP